MGQPFVPEKELGGCAVEPDHQDLGHGVFFLDLNSEKPLEGQRGESGDDQEKDEPVGFPSQQVDPAVRIVHRDAFCERVRRQRRLCRVLQDVPKFPGRSYSRDPRQSLVGGDDLFLHLPALKQEGQQVGSLPLGADAPVHLPCVGDAQGFPHQSQAVAGLQPHPGEIDALSGQLQGHQGGSRPV